MRNLLPAIDSELESVGLVRLATVSSPALEHRESGTGLPHTIVLVGNAGPRMWGAFTASAEFGASPDPLDRWSRQVLSTLADNHDASVRFPFDGPPYWPFQRWAMATGSFSASPLGVLVHAVYGPWFAFRGALVLPGEFDSQPAEKNGGPCPHCTEKPCLDACPAGALGRNRGYDVDACRTHVRQGGPASCAGLGCLARHACPVGREYAYAPEQASHHMAAFSK